MRLTMIGHSTVLIETEGKKILTDPYWGTWGNPAFARFGIPAKTRQEMSDVDGILISHDHWDHVDAKYLRLIGDTPVIVPQITRWLFKLLGGRNLIGIKAWEVMDLNGITITAVPAIHLTATVGYILQSENKQVYFAGDTFYRPFMQEIGSKFQLDAALMPVTTYRIPMTMGEKGAVKAVQALKPSVVIPIHLGIKPRSPLLRTGQTPEGFSHQLEEKGIKTRIAILREGESYTL
jgi:L-ascorbate metabolism protein UlaG (beta-lactamase superfamily)